MTSLPAATLQVQLIEPVRLPTNSYRQRGSRFGRFQPFDLLDDSDAFDQILSYNTINEETIKEIKELGKELSEEYCGDIKGKIEKLNNKEQLDEIQQDVEKILNKGTLVRLEERITSVEAKISGIEEKLDRIITKLG